MFGVKRIIGIKYISEGVLSKKQNDISKRQIKKKNQY